MKIPQFLAKLSSKQIYGILGISTILFVIIGFVVAQNIQNYGKNSVNSQANSQPENPAKSLNSSNKNGEINPNSQNQDSDKNLQKRYFKGKIDNLPIRMILNFPCSEPACWPDNFSGEYIYEYVSTYPLKIKSKNARSISFTEYNKDLETGYFLQENVNDNTRKITGTWSNLDKTVKLPFSLEKAEEFRLEDFLVTKTANISDFNYDKTVLQKYTKAKGCKEYRLDK